MLQQMHRWLLPFAGLALALSACGGGGDAKPTGSGAGRNAGPVPVVVETVREQPWTDALRALGTVQAHEADKEHLDSLNMIAHLVESKRAA